MDISQSYKFHYKHDDARGIFEGKRKANIARSLRIITKLKIMKLKAIILGLFVFALAATVQAQHTSSHEKISKIEKPVKYKGDKKVVSRKQSQSKATVAKRKALKNEKAASAKRKAKYGKKGTVKQSKKVAYKKKSTSDKEVARTKKHQKRKSKLLLKESAATH